MKITRFFRCCLPGIVLLYLSGCASVNDLGLYLVESSADSYLSVNGQILNGKVYLTPGRSGRVAFSSTEGAISSCNGSLHYSGTNTGEIDLRCNDGSAAVLKVTLITETRGFAYGRTDTAPASLAFGLSKQASMAYLSPQAPVANTGATEQ
jgi:hypothetical protein